MTTAASADHGMPGSSQVSPTMNVKYSRPLAGTGLSEHSLAWLASGP